MSEHGDKRPPPPVRLVAGASIIFAVEALFMAWVLAGGLPVLFAVLFHCSLTAGLSWMVYRRRAIRHEHAWIWLLAVSVGLLGPLGAMGTALTAMLNREYARTAISFDDWYASLFPEEEMDLEDVLMERIRAGQHSGGDGGGVTPFLDLMAFGTPDQKRSLIGILTKDFQPEFTPALRMALADPEAGVRVQAAAALTRISEMFAMTAQSLEQRVVQGDSEASKELADHYTRYSGAGLLDPSLESESRAKALEFYQTYLRDRPDHAEAVCSAAGILLKTGRVAEAEGLLQTALDLGANSKALDLLYMDTLFRRNGFEELRQHARRSISEFESGGFDPDAEAVRLWAGVGGETAP